MDAKVEAQRTWPCNFVDHLRTLATKRPRDIALVVADEHDGTPLDTAITYEELDVRIRALAALLQEKFEPRDRALLLLDNNDHYVVAFFACLYAGLIAVPVFPPESTREQHMARLRVIAHDSQASGILTSSDVLALAGPALAEFGNADVIAVDAIDRAGADHWIPQSPVEDAIAFLQYTSGSTSDPKGVMVSHGNLMANERVIEQALSITEDDVFVSWLPLFHDMGLIGGLLQPIHRGIKLVLMTPQFFLQRPARWLKAISRHRATISGGPDFAYRLCIERIKDAQLAGLDLSSWRIAYSGAEPVRHDTLSAFAGRFSGAGFPASAVCPCYGLAEATLMVTAGQTGAGMVAHGFQNKAPKRGDIVPDPEGKTLVACGAVVAGHQVNIRDRDGQTICAGDTVGEIWVCGPSVARGYWNKSKETAETFVEQDDKTWLKTGDLGFMHEGQLYVAGRVKDLIIVRGHNLYPQDIECVIESEVEAVRKSRVAAFAVDGPEGEGIGVAAEISRGLQKLVPADKLVEALSIAVSEACGEPLSVAVLLNSGGLPKTSSGKLQRRACCQGWLDETLDAYAIHEHGRFVLGGSDDRAPAGPELDELESELAEIWATALKNTDAKTLDCDSHFFAAGGNSLAATQVAAAIESHWHVAFPVRQLFEHPRLSGCAAELRRRLADGSRAVAESIPALLPEQRNKPLPLSPAQQRQWFLWRLDPTSTAYHIQGALRLTGSLNRDALTVAVAGLAERHESLRTIFSERADGEVAQHIEATVRLELRFVDLRDAPDVEARATDILRGLNGEPFDLTAGPLARMTLIRLSETGHILAMVMHHIIADGVSMQILLDELAERYVAAEQNREPDLPALPVQYADFSVWQRRWLGEGVGERQLTYWRDRLGREHPLLALPTDYPRPPVAHYRASVHRLELPAALVAALRGLADANGTTLFTVLLAGFQTLLYRYTGQQDIRTGMPAANRTRIETQGVVGFFVNTLILRNVIDGRSSLAQVLVNAKADLLGAQANQDLPFEQLVEALRPARSPGHNPLFQVLVNHRWEDYRALATMTELSVAAEPTVPEAAQFEMAVDMLERPDGVEVHLTYAAELFEAATIERFGEHYLTVLNAQATRPDDTTVAGIALPSPQERLELDQWSRGEPGEVSESIVHRMFEAQVARCPNAPALRFDADELSYEELNKWANRLAHHLINLGVAPETRVAVVMERSIELVITLLAIMKAGGAYVPIDPEHPAERIRYVLADSAAPLLLTQRHLADSLPVDNDVQVLTIDTIELPPKPDHNPSLSLHGDNLVYLIYTSGSTGRPKGAGNRHRSLCNRLCWGQHHSALDDRDVVLQKTPFSFDISFWEFFWPLTTGAVLALARPGEHRDPQRLLALIDHQRITTIHFVPSMLQALFDSGELNPRAQIKRVICSGEALPANLQAKVFNAFPQASLHNLYGPTEAAIEVSYWDCRDAAALTVPIGRPIAGLNAQVLDAELNLVPRGVAGELYLGGIGLARGYWRRPDLTAERFIASGGGERLYRTGDLVRWNSEGQLEYLGRVDHQLKIRGFRIELGEVEARLRELPGVGEAVVVARHDLTDTRLVAYLVTAGGEEVEPWQLRTALGAALPDYMLPSAFVKLERLPLNSNGKVDRNALPAPAAPARSDYQAPAGKTAAMLAAVWTEVLGVDRVGANDNFFDLGGHSLQLIRVHRLLQERFQSPLTVLDLFRYPTVASLSARIDNGPDDTVQDLEATALRRRGAMRRRRQAVEGVN